MTANHIFWPQACSLPLPNENGHSSSNWLIRAGSANALAISLGIANGQRASTWWYPQKKVKSEVWTKKLEYEPLWNSMISSNHPFVHVGTVFPQMVHTSKPRHAIKLGWSHSGPQKSAIGWLTTSIVLYWWVLSHPWTPKEKRQHGKGLGLDPPVAIVPTIAAPELQLSESPHILKRYDTPPAEHGSARLRRRLEGLTFELGWDFARQFSQRCKLHLFCRFFVFVPLKLAKLVSIWDSNTQRAQKGKT